MCGTVLGASCTSPSGALVVRAATMTSDKFKTVSSAVAALPSDGSLKIIFIFPGTYNEQVYITRSGTLTIFGYTRDTSTYTSNQVTIQAEFGGNATISDDVSGTLRIHKDDFKIYNVNIKNSFGLGTQAIAISQYGTRVGLYACEFFGYHDTVLVEQGLQVFLKGYIEGATDFIFGQRGQAYFGGNTIAIKGAGYVTASGRSSNDGTSCEMMMHLYVFNQNTIVTASGASGFDGKVYLGRPWSLIFKNTVITAPMNKALWSAWSTTRPHTDNIFVSDFNMTETSFATLLTASQANGYTISSAVGTDYSN
ncbi:carbohydrate esterase family 8 protein [Crucibulum laeve]|uniref:Pectinesterase n=1 Tax=Crucibulum laeve TaxID=68775 RepID=A0A5C3LLU1_9AGAR|nr:carbohydrate esterase family 8 protein [Crucibulum laeve]